MHKTGLVERDSAEAFGEGFRQERTDRMMLKIASIKLR
jgi:hypothetical protein